MCNQLIQHRPAGRAFVLVLALALCAIAPTQASADSGRWLTGYYATYNNAVMGTSQVYYNQLTHVIYWPVIPNANGTLNTTPFGLSAATFAAGANDLVTRAHAAGAKALIGIGGDASSGATAGFEGSTQAALLSTFITNIVNLMSLYKFDGVDINWEQITTADNAKFTSFITALRTKLNTIAPRPLLTMAPETQSNGGRPDLIGPIYQDFDQINIQTYIMSGPYCGWETWFNSPLNNGGATFATAPDEQLPSITNALADYTKVGIPISRLAMGAQLDVAVWQGGSGTSTGGVTMPKQTWTYAANCVDSDPGAPSFSTMPYRQMVATLLGAPGYTSHFDTVADQSWLSFNAGPGNDANDRFVSYDSAQSLAKKGTDLSPAQAGVGGTLGGVFLFELSGDFVPGAAGAQHPLLTAAHAMKVLLPGLVTNLAATASGTSAKLTWTAAPGASSYKVFFENGPGTGPSALAANALTNQATIAGLTAGQKYYFLAEGVNAFGAGVTAEVSVTVVAAPGAVTGLQALPGNQAVLLKWNAAAGATSYSVFTGAGSLLVSGLTATTYVRSSLINGQSYSFYVVAVNAGGTNKSATVSATPAAVPAAPVLSATATTGHATLTWTAVPGALSYTLFGGTTPGGENNSLPGIKTTTFTGSLSNGVTYYYYVKAVNAAGSSWPSNERKVTPIAAPTGVSATAGNASINLKWNAVTGATCYLLFIGKSQITEAQFGGCLAATTYKFAGLTNGQQYWLAVKAANASGVSVASASVSATPVGAPAAPTGLSASPVSIAGSVTLKWTASAGATATYSYNIYQGTTAGGEGAAAVKTVTNNAVTATITGLASNKTYYFKVRASNGSLSLPSNEASAAPRVVWIPDYYGGLVQVRIGGGATITAITLNLTKCNPNAVAVNSNKLYVACNNSNGNPDQILVFNAATIRASAAGVQTPVALQTITNADFRSLIGITFDSHNNLWIASNGNNDILSISAATLNTAAPVVTVNLVDSPDSPVALAFDTDGSLWVTGLFGDGILLNFPTSQLNLGAAAVPRYCISTDNLGAGCQSQANLFKEPEGVALFGGGVWVANNSTGAAGTTPGRELVNLKVVAGALSVNAVFGQSGTPASSPFVCPGGLFSTTSHLWLNDESYGEAVPQCGAAGDVASKTGGVFSFSSTQLAAKTTTISQVLSFANVTGRPGFGGVFVENDQ